MLENTAYWELPHMYSSPHIIRVTKPGRPRWVGHVACTGRREIYTVFW